MSPAATWREQRPSAGDIVLWSLGVVFLLAAVSPALLACDGGTAVPNPGNNPGLVSDCEVLLELRNELAGTGSLNWDTQLAMTQWQGIRISGSPSRVTEVSGYQLTGVIPLELGQLSQLRQLYLGGNQLTGPIPLELGQLSQLRRLSLGGNQLTGPIPPELGQLFQLELLHLGTNQLTGEIPAELGRLSQLQWLHLDDNQLTGVIPAELDQLSGLRQLHLDDNQLTGTIPVELGRLSRLEWLYLDDNQLTGPIPIELGQLRRLEQLYLGNNQLAGSIPTELGQLALIRELNLYNNQLTGPIPPELGRLSRMWKLVLGGNQLTGPIPTGLGQFSDLQYLVLSNNQLTGSIPTELGQLSELLWLHLQNNQLTGPIPPELGQLSELRELHLQNNQLTGTIPPELSQLSELLRELHLQNNQLTGPIPTELGQLSQLREFSFRGNRLAGPVPTPLNHLPDVYVLNLAASWIGPGQMKVTWDDPGDPTASYEYRLWDPVQDWTDWGEIADPEMTLRAREERTIEWTLTVLPAHSDDRFRIVYTHIGLRASNRKGYSPETIAELRPLEVSGATDQGPVDAPYCRSRLFYLWPYAPCATTAVLPQVVMGPLGENIAQTEIILTNREPRHQSCEVGLLFHRGTSEGPEVSFNDPDAQLVRHNLIRTSISRGGAQIVTLTPAGVQQLVIGAVWVFVRSPCSVDSLQVQGRYLLENRVDGEIAEIFSVSSQSPQEWLGDGDCQVLTGIFGEGRDVGFASVTREPEQGAPAGTWLHFRSFDLEGNPTGNPPSLEISGGHDASFPWSFEEPTIIEMCLEVPETDSDFYLSTLAIGITQTGTRQQWSDEIFVDVFSLDQPSAWSEPDP